MFKTLRKPAFLKIYVLPLLTTSVGAMNQAISILFALELGADVLQINLITTIRSTMSIFLLIPFGILSDRFGRRPMVIYPRALMWLGTMVRAFATDPNHLLIASLVGGFSGGSYFPVLLSMIADMAEPEEQQESISILFLFSSIGMVFGPLITTLLLSFPQITLRNIYQISAIAEFSVLIYLATQIRETKLTTSFEQRGTIDSILDLLHKPNFQGLIAMVFMFFFSRSIIQTYLPIYASVDLKLSNAEVASFAFYRNLSIMIIRFLSASLLTRVPIKKYLFIVLLLGGMSASFSPLAENYLAIVLIFFASGLSFGATRILSTTLVVKNSNPVNRGIANSLLNLGQSSGNITKLLTSPIVDVFGLVPAFLLGGITGFITIIPLLFIKVPPSPQSPSNG